MVSLDCINQTETAKISNLYEEIKERWFDIGLKKSTVMIVVIIRENVTTVFLKIVQIAKNIKNGE